jgi:hypothetical protein
MIEGPSTVRGLSVFALIALPYSPVVPADKAVAAGTGANANTTTAHASLEAFGALMTKALARFHGAPALGVIVLITTLPEAIVSGIPSVSPVPSKPVASILRVVGAAAKIEAVGTILSLRISEPLLSFAGSAIAH